MKATHSLFLCTFALVCFSAVSANFFPDFPVTTFLWSGNNFFADHIQVGKSLSSKAIADLVTRITDRETKIKAELWDYAQQDASSPEVFLVFVEPKSQIHHQAYSFLQSTVTGSSSSVIAPYVYRDVNSHVVSEQLLNAFHLASSAKRIVVSHEGRSDAISVEQLMDSLQSTNKDIFNNGVVDLVLVFLPADASISENIVTTVDTAIKRASTGNYVALFTANTEFEREKMRVARESTESTEERQMQLRDSNYYAERKFWPHQVWEGLLISWILLFILAIGIQWTIQLQTPDRWEGEEKRKKERRDARA